MLHAYRQCERTRVRGAGRACAAWVLAHGLGPTVVNLCLCIVQRLGRVGTVCSIGASWLTWAWLIAGMDVDQLVHRGHDRGPLQGVLMAEGVLQGPALAGLLPVCVLAYAPGHFAQSRAGHVFGQCLFLVALVIRDAVRCAPERMAGRLLLTSLLTYLPPATALVGVLQCPWVGGACCACCVCLFEMWMAHSHAKQDGAMPRDGHVVLQANFWLCCVGSQRGSGVLTGLLTGSVTGFGGKATAYGGQVTVDQNCRSGHMLGRTGAQYWFCHGGLCVCLCFCGSDAATRVLDAARHVCVSFCGVVCDQWAVTNASWVCPRRLPLRCCCGWVLALAKWRCGG